MTSADTASPQDEIEARSYYYGLPSNPILVYRTGAPWKRPTGCEAYCVPKEARPVFDHQITDVWDELGPRVLDYLDSINVAWTTIDVIRFAPKGEGPGPPVLWIGVKPGSLTREHAKVAVVGCEELLQQFELIDVEVGLRESHFIRSAGSKLLNHAFSHHGTAGVRGPLTPALGLQIAARATPNTEGTGALYIRESSHSKRVFILTARHVVLPPNAGPNELYVCENVYRRRDVLLFGRKAFQNFLESIMAKIGENISTVNCYNRYLKELASDGGEDDDDGKKERTRLQGVLQESEKAIDILNGFHSEVTKYWSAESQRVLGHIAYSPPMSVHAGTKCFREDWALIEVDNEKIDWKNFKGNVIDLGTEMSAGEFTMKMRPNLAAPSSFRYPLCRLFPLHCVAKDERLRHPTMLDEDGDGCKLVIKNGTSTGVTVGRASGMMSFVREYLQNGDRETSTELAIYPCGYWPPHGFSAPGDSGAIVADHEGRILGLIDGGTGDGDDLDVTYATPFYWLFDECIKKQFPDACLYEPQPI